MVDTGQQYDKYTQCPWMHTYAMFPVGSITLEGLNEMNVCQGLQNSLYFRLPGSPNDLKYLSKIINPVAVFAVVVGENQNVNTSDSRMLQFYLSPSSTHSRAFLRAQITGNQTSCVLSGRSLITAVPGFLHPSISRYLFSGSSAPK